MVMVVIAAAVTIVIMGLPCLLGLKFGLQLEVVHHNGAIFCIAIDALHAVITYLVRVQVAAVTFTAADALSFFQYTLFFQCHINQLPLKL